MSKRAMSSFLGYILFNVASTIYNKYLITHTPFPFPFFVAFFYSIWFNLALGITIIVLMICKKPLRIQSIRDVPLYIHIVGITHALSQGLFFLSLSAMDVPTIYAMSSLEPLFYYIFPMLFFVKYLSPYTYTKTAIIAVMFGLLVSNTLVLALNPNSTLMGILYTLFSIAMSSFNAFLMMKLKLDSKLSTPTILLYTNMESMIWMFGLAFIIDLRPITDYYGSLSVGFSLLAGGVFIEGLKIVITTYIVFSIPYAEKTPYLRQWLMTVGIPLSFIIFQLTYHPMNYVGFVVVVLFSIGNEYANRGKHIAIDRDIGIIIMPSDQESMNESLESSESLIRQDGQNVDLDHPNVIDPNEVPMKFEIGQYTAND